MIAGGSFSLSVAAGRWIVLSFLGSPADPRAERELAEMLPTCSSCFTKIGWFSTAYSPRFRRTPRLISKLSTPAMSFLADYDGEISRLFGAAAMPRTIILDPMLRAIADIPWDYAAGHAQTVRDVLKSLPESTTSPACR